MKRVVFYLMNKKGYFVLENFLKNFDSNNIEYIVVGEDNNVKNDYSVPIKKLCKKYKIRFYLKNSFIPEFDGYKFAIGWRWIIDDANRLIVFHDSLLPKYRGFAPLVNMLINKETILGVTSLYASKYYDKGDIIFQEKIKVEYPIKIKHAIEKISPLYYRLVEKIFMLIQSNSDILGTKQNEEEATYSLWLDDKDYEINWSDSSSRIKRKVDAVGFPYNGAVSYLNEEKIIIEGVEKYPDLIIENRDIGKVIMVENKYPIVVCGEGLIKIIKASYYNNNETILPLSKFRSRFGRT